MPTSNSDNVTACPEMDLTEFSEGGYLAAVNMNVLHPVGLALAYDPDVKLLFVLDSRDDPEGVSMAPETLEAIHDRLARFRAEWAARMPARRAALGYMIQPDADEA